MSPKKTLALVIAETAHASRQSYAEALTAFRLDLGQKLAAAVDTADTFRDQGRPQVWIDGEQSAARQYAAELLAIADLTSAEVNVIWNLRQPNPFGAARPAPNPRCTVGICQLVADKGMPWCPKHRGHNNGD